MKKSKEDLHEMADYCRMSAEREYSEYNDEVERKAIEEFEKGETAKYFRENARYVTGVVLKRLEAVQKGEMTFPIRIFDSEMLARLLSSETTVDAVVKGFDDELSDEETIEAWENDDLIKDGYTTACDTSASLAQGDLIAALLEYATAAASYAKHIASASLLEWAEMIDILKNNKNPFGCRVTPERALRLIELEKSAANRLRLDRVIAELPPYKPCKKAKK